MFKINVLLFNPFLKSTKSLIKLIISFINFLLLLKNSIYILFEFVFKIISSIDNLDCFFVFIDSFLYSNKLYVYNILYTLFMLLFTILYNIISVNKYISSFKYIE